MIPVFGRQKLLGDIGKQWPKTLPLGAGGTIKTASEEGQFSKSNATGAGRPAGIGSTRFLALRLTAQGHLSGSPKETAGCPSSDLLFSLFLLAVVNFYPDRQACHLTLFTIHPAPVFDQNCSASRQTRTSARAIPVFGRQKTFYWGTPVNEWPPTKYAKTLPLDRGDTSKTATLTLTLKKKASFWLKRSLAHLQFVVIKKLFDSIR